MYTKPKNNLNNNMWDLTRYFEDTDIMDSLFLKELPKLPSYDSILITSKRYDLLAKSVYNNDKLGWILQFYSGILEDDLILGRYLPYPSLDSVSNLIVSLNELNN